MKKKRSFVKLFNDKENVKKAIMMINTGNSYRCIGKELGCDKSAVIAFHKRKIKEGIIFKDFGKIKRKSKEKINTGMSYAEYLAEDDAKNVKIRAKNMRKARKTIDGLIKNRNGKELVFDKFSFLD